MRKTFLASLLLTMLSAQAEQLLSPLYDNSYTQQTQEYMTDAITLQKDHQLDEGILAYANHVAHGNKVTVVSSSQGLAIYNQIDDQYQLVREIRNAELGLEQHDDISQLRVSDTDKWLLYRVNGKAVTIPLDQQHQPLLAARNELDTGYGDTLLINNGIAVVKNGTNITTFTIDATDGVMAALSTIQMSYYPEYVALVNDTLLAAQSSWQNDSKNLTVYKLDNNGQWQFVSDHSMTTANSNSQSVRYVTFSTDGQRVMYGNSDLSYILQVDPVTGQLTEAASGQYLNNYYSEVQFIDEKNVIIRTNNQLSLFDSQQLTQLASINLDTQVPGIKELALGFSNTPMLTVLSQNGLLQLSADTLTVNTSLAPGEQDVVLDFADTSNLMTLNDNYILQRSENALRLFKLDQQGMPELKQVSTPMQLLGHETYYYELEVRKLSNELYAIFQAEHYSILKLDDTNEKLQLLGSGRLSDRNGDRLFTSDNTMINLGSSLVIARSDTLNLLRLTEDYKFSFVDAVVNGASGVSGIAQIQLLMVAGDNIYTVDQYNQVISHFVINQNRLQQQKQYQSYAFPQVFGYFLRNGMLTLQSNDYLQNYQVAENGELTLLSNQYLPEGISHWVPVGERFLAVKSWQSLYILEQDNRTGHWSERLNLDNQQLQQDYQLSQTSLLALGGNIGLYDQQNKRLVHFSHNTAPYVANDAQLQLQLNQGKTYQLALDSVIFDEEDASLSFNLQNTADSFSLTNGQLTFNGAGNTTSGVVEIEAKDQAELATLINFSYQLNLAPIAKTSLPVFNVVEETAIQLELAQHFVDPEGQALQFTLPSTLPGLTLSSTGLLTGKLSSAGEVSLNITVSDSAGATANHVVQLSAAAKPEESSGGSLHWLLLSLLAVTAVGRKNRQSN